MVDVNLRERMTECGSFKVFHYKKIDSTQKEIWRRVKSGTIDDRTMIIADIQTAGIGTHGRVWHTDEENNIAFSVYFDFIGKNSRIDEFEGLTVEIAKKIVDVFEDLYGIRLDIKFPNDIYCNGKKLGGILTETKVQDGLVRCVVIGIGINTNQVQFTDEIEGIATSIRREFGIEVDNEKVILKWGRFLFQKRTVPISKKEENFNENRFFISRPRLTICWNGKRII